MEKKSPHLPIVENIAKSLSPYFPKLEKKLKMAGIEKSKEEFLEWVVISSLAFALLITLIFLVVFLNYHVSLLWLLPIFVVGLWFGFYNYFHVPDLKLIKKKKAIEYDLTYATRQLIIEISSGVPLFEALLSLTKGYGQLSKEIKGIVERVTLGEPLTYVLKDVAENTPSPAFKRVLLQIANSVISGADIASSLSSVVDQISKEQIIELKEYGNKMNPLVMFYLVLGVIFPTLGITFLIILLSFVQKGAKLPFYYLVILAFLVGAFQLMFLAFVETARPRYAMLS